MTRLFVAKYMGSLYTDAPGTTEQRDRKKRKEKTDRNGPDRTFKPSEIFMIMQRPSGCIRVERMGGVEHARSHMCACSVVEVARDKMMKREVKGEEDGREGKVEIQGASFEQYLLGVLGA
jgi:hypothetical protein